MRIALAPLMYCADHFTQNLCVQLNRVQNVVWYFNLGIIDLIVSGHHFISAGKLASVAFTLDTNSFADSAAHCSEFSESFATKFQDNTLLGNIALIGNLVGCGDLTVVNIMAGLSESRAYTTVAGNSVNGYPLVDNNQSAPAVASCVKEGLRADSAIDYRRIREIFSWQTGDFAGLYPVLD